MKNKRLITLCSYVLLSISLILGFSSCTSAPEVQEEGNTVADQCAQILLENNPEPVFGSIGGDWVAFGLGRWGGEVPQDWYDSYYSNVEEYVTQCQGVLHSRKYTEYSRLILALTSIGKDPSDVAGFNMLKPLADFEQTIFQGVNGPVYALLALDCGNYEMPVLDGEGIQATREMYVDYILEKESEGGGWSLAGGEAEADLTAMALQALAKYQDRQDVAEAVDRALTVLSNMQCSDGGYIMYDTESCESTAQVIVALTELNIDAEDARFVKEGTTLEDNLLSFLTSQGGFSHVPGGEVDAMATEQAFYALVALERAKEGMTSLYEMK